MTKSQDSASIDKSPRRAPLGNKHSIRNLDLEHQQRTRTKDSIPLSFELDNSIKNLKVGKPARKPSPSAKNDNDPRVENIPSQSPSIAPIKDITSVTPAINFSDPPSTSLPPHNVLPRSSTLAAELARAKLIRSTLPSSVSTTSTSTRADDPYLFRIREHICACGRAQRIGPRDTIFNTTLISQISSGLRTFLSDIHLGFKRKIFLYGPCRCDVPDASITKKQISRAAPGMNRMRERKMYLCGCVKERGRERLGELMEAQRPVVGKTGVRDEMLCCYSMQSCEKGCEDRLGEGKGMEEVFETFFVEACRETICGAGWMSDF